MNQPLFSVIIPHFNSGGLLQRLLDSIPAERDIQVIVVDDVSSDGSFEQIKSNPENDRVSFIRSTNKTHAGGARNIGLDNASGKFLIFADSDDYFDKNAFEYFRREVAHNPCDLTLFQVTSFIEGSNELGTRHNYLKSIYLEPGLFKYMAIDQPCGKIIRRALVEEFGVRFSEVPAGNDVLFSAHVSVFAKSRKFIPTTVYKISQNNTSITSEESTTNFTSRLNQQIQKTLLLKSSTACWFWYLFLIRRNALTLCSKNICDKDFIGLASFYKKLLPKPALLVHLLFKRLSSR